MPDKKLPRGIRNLNPGNIRKNSANKWQGLADIQPDNEFCTFQDMPYGIRAMARLLINYQDKKDANTVRELVGRYAPPSENNTQGYVNSVCNYMTDRLEEHIDAITKINTHDYYTLRALIEAMVQVENGGKWDSYITESQMVKGLLMAGVEAPKKPLAQSRIIQGQKAAATAVAGSVITDSLVHVEYVKTQLVTLIPYSDYLKYAFLAMALLGIFLTVYARVDDRKKGVN
jgi:hypothetical protein